MTQCAALTMAAIPTTSPAPGHAGGGVKVSSEPESGERGEREACSDPDKRDEQREGEMVPCRDQGEARDQIRNRYYFFNVPFQSKVLQCCHCKF